MTNDYKAFEIANEVKESLLKEGANVDYAQHCALLAQKVAMNMAEWKDKQPQIIEIFGKRVKIVKDTKDIDGCEICTFSSKCHHIDVGSLCEDSSFNTNRHFVEVDEDGNEIE